MFEQVTEFRCRYRSAEIVSLTLRAAELLKDCKLFSCFYALGNYPHMQRSSQTDYRSDDTGIILTRREVMNEGFIDL